MIDEELLKKLYKDSEEELRDTIDKLPTPALPVVTQEDASKKFIVRYFVRQVNDQMYVTEIDKTQYEDLKENPRFITTTIKWKIVGKKETIKHSSGANLYGVEDQNRITVADADLTFGGLRRYISSYLEYWVSET
jgi:hypothetical protein